MIAHEQKALSLASLPEQWLTVNLRNASSLLNILSQRRNHGFSLVELMVTLAVLGILVAVAGPSMQRMIRQSRLDADVERVQSAMTYARSEARKRSSTVSIIPSAVGWKGGWRIITDDGAKNPNCALDTALGERTLRVQDQVSTSTNFLFAASAASTTTGISCATASVTVPACLSFDLNELAIQTNGAFLATTFCLRDQDDPTSVYRAITINSTGQPYLAKVKN